VRFLLSAALAAGAAYLVVKYSVRYLGDKAKVGDDVFVPVTPGAPTIPGLPAGIGQYMVHVTGTSGGDVLTGQITGFSMAGAANFLPLPQGMPMQVASVDRSNVTGILRNGAAVSS
jgi:hypothetical protein